MACKYANSLRTHQQLHPLSRSAQPSRAGTCALLGKASQASNHSGLATWAPVCLPLLLQLQGGTMTSRARGHWGAGSGQAGEGGLVIDLGSSAVGAPAPASRSAASGPAAGALVLAVRICQACKLVSCRCRANCSAGVLSLACGLS